jgi:MFS family permease
VVSELGKAFAGTGLTLSTIILPVAVVRDEKLAMALLMFTCLSYGLYSSNVFAITQTLAGPRAAGKWTGLQNGFGNLAGVAAPVLTGWIVQQTGQFYWAHEMACPSENELYVAEILTWRVQKLILRPDQQRAQVEQR